MQALAQPLSDYLVGLRTSKLPMVAHPTLGPALDNLIRAGVVVAMEGAEVGIAKLAAAKAAK